MSFWPDGVSVALVSADARPVDGRGRVVDLEVGVDVDLEVAPRKARLGMVRPRWGQRGERSGDDRDGRHDGDADGPAPPPGDSVAYSSGHGPVSNRERRATGFRPVPTGTTCAVRDDASDVRADHGTAHPALRTAALRLMSRTSSPCRSATARRRREPRHRATCGRRPPPAPGGRTKTTRRRWRVVPGGRRGVGTEAGRRAHDRTSVREDRGHRLARGDTSHRREPSSPEGPPAPPFRVSASPVAPPSVRRPRCPGWHRAARGDVSTPASFREAEASGTVALHVRAMTRASVDAPPRPSITARSLRA